MRGDDGADDGQAKTRPATAADPVGAQAPERLEEGGHQLGGHPLAGVPHDEHRPGGEIRGLHLHPRLGDVRVPVPSRGVPP